MSESQLATVESPIVITQYEVLLGDIKEAEENAVKSFEYATKTGDKEARSYIYKLRQLRAKIEAQRKEAKAYSLEYGKTVDSRAKELTGQVDALIAPHQAALDAIARAEAERIQGHERRLSTAVALGLVAWGADAATIRGQLEAVNALSLDGLEEFSDRVTAAVAKSREHLTVALAAREKADANASELARLRREAEERRQKEAKAEDVSAGLEQPAPAATAGPAFSGVARPSSSPAVSPAPGAAAAAAASRKRKILVDQLLAAMGAMRREAVANAIADGRLHPAVSVDWEAVR